MNIQELFAQQDLVLRLTFITLIVMSIITWATIIIRTVKLLAAKSGNKHFLRTFWHASDMRSAVQSVEKISSPMSAVATESYQARKAYDGQKYSHLHDAVPLNEYITRHIRYSLDKHLRSFSNGLTALASIGAVAPFVGLFGTVWGIYHALINIGQAGQVNIAAVAPPIGEALIATAAGLFTAIPAVLAYNALVRANKNLTHDMDGFAHDLHVQLLNDKE